MTVGLSDKEIALITGVLRLHPGVTRAVVFGSRAKGNHRPNSDIDLAIYGEINDRLLARLNTEMDDLPMPYLFDVVAYEKINHAALRQHIDTVGYEIYAASPR